MVESLCSWSSLRFGAPDTQELKIKTAIGEMKTIRDTCGAFLFMCMHALIFKIKLWRTAVWRHLDRVDKGCGLPIHVRIAAATAARI